MKPFFKEVEFYQNKIKFLQIRKKLQLYRFIPIEDCVFQKINMKRFKDMSKQIVKMKMYFN